MQSSVKTILGVVFGLLMMTSFQGVSEPDIYPSLFVKANDLYREGDFSKAAESYELLINEGFGNANVHYNLGNCYYRLNKNPLAILHYEKALKQDPDFEDASANLKLAQKKNIDKFEVLPKSLMSRVVNSVLEFLNVTTWSILTVIFAVVSFALLFAFYYKGRTNTGFFVFSIISITLSFVFLFVTWQADKLHSGKVYSIVVSANVYVKTEPSQSATDALILHEGTKVKCLDVLDGWYNISLIDGRVGWVKEEALKEI